MFPFIFLKFQSAFLQTRLLDTLTTTSSTAHDFRLGSITLCGITFPIDSTCAHFEKIRQDLRHKIHICKYTPGFQNLKYFYSFFMSLSFSIISYLLSYMYNFPKEKKSRLVIDPLMMSL